MVQIQCQPSVTAAVRKGLSKPVFHPRQTSVQETQGLGLLWVTFPSCSLLITHGLRLLVHTTALISVKPLPLLSQPSLPSSPSVWRHSTPSMWSSLARELKDAQPSPPPVKQKQLPTPCAVSTEQQPEPSQLCNLSSRQWAPVGRDGQSLSNQQKQDRSWAASPQREA